MTKRIVAVRGRKRARIEPLFPGYLFAKTKLAQDALRIRGVSDIVKTERSGYCRLANSEIARLRGLEREDGFIWLDELDDAERFAIDQVVQILGGVIEHGRFAGRDADGRARVRYEMLGREHVTHVEDSALVAA